MKYTSRVLSYFFCIIVQAIAFEAQALSGIIQDQNGVGLEKALIEITIGSTTYRTYSGARGGFEIDTLPLNKAYALKAKKSGYSENTASGNSSDAADVKVPLQVQMVKLQATIMTREGMPLANAIVDAKKLGVKVSDALGKVSFDAPFGTPYEFKVTLGNYYFRGRVAGVLEGDVERVVAGELN